MKIAFFVHGYLPWDAYGVPRYVEQLSKYLAKMGHEIYIIVVGRSNLPKREAAAPNIKVYRTAYFDLHLKKLTPLWSLASYTFSSLIEVSNFVKKEGIQILHGHTLEWGGLQSILVSKITRKPCVITIHGAGLDKFSELNFPHNLGFLKWADLLICQRKLTTEKLIHWGIPKSKIALFPGALVDMDKFSSNSKKPVQKSLIVTFVGRLVPFKGPNLFLDAIAVIKPSIKNVVFQIVGDGPLMQSLIQKAQSMNLNSQVKFLGIRDDIDKVLQESDVYVACSPYENFSSLVLFEAMSCGLPIVATDVGETRILTEDSKTLLLADPNAVSLAEKISLVLKDQELRKRLGKNARKLVEQKYSSHIVLENHLTAYKEVLRNAHRR